MHQPHVTGTDVTALHIAVYNGWCCYLALEYETIVRVQSSRLVPFDEHSWRRY